jgi:hypothetical protein
MRGPNTDPWGTPAETGSKLDQEFLLITFCLLLNTEILFFSNTGNIDNIEFSFNGKSIPLSTSHKHLGVILSQNVGVFCGISALIVFPNLSQHINTPIL